MSVRSGPSSSAAAPVEGADFIVVGAGIAGASVAWDLARRGRTVLLERESQPGYHTTGRSAALYLESYGTAQVQALTRASRAFFDDPGEGFAEHALLRPRGALMVAGPDDHAALREHWAMLQAAVPKAQRLDAAGVLALWPALRPDWVMGGTFEPDAADIDVHALHQGFLRGLRRRGGQLVCDAEVRAVAQVGANWRVQAGGRTWQAPVLINAAGAWCDALAALAGIAPLGLQPKRRSAFTFAAPAGSGATGWPACVALDHSWYVKPDAAQLLGSPANEDPAPPQDVQPEELDIAVGVHRIEQATTLAVRPTRRWAGLRSFVPDGDIVGGFDSQAEGFFWLAGQGGFGIQTSPAMGMACAALAAGEPLPQWVVDAGVSASRLGPARLRQSSSPDLGQTG